MIEKFNEFINVDNVLIKELIRQGENTPSSDLYAISKREPYRKVISMGAEVTPYLLKRIYETNSPVWVNALCEIKGIKLDSTKLSSSERTNFWKNWGIENGHKKQ